MIRWEDQGDGRWVGFSGELPVATLTRDENTGRERWLWSIIGAKRPKWWRKGSGHRTTWIAARRSAESYWDKWLQSAGLRPDLERLALQSLPGAERRKRGRRPT